MTQHPHDQLAKQLLEELLAPLGTVQRSLEIPGEAKWVDLWFIPHHEDQATEFSAADILSKIAQTPCLLEPYRNPPNRFEVRSCLLKLLWVQEDLRRKAGKQEQATVEETLPFLWILATSISKPVLQEFGAEGNAGWGDGIYFMAPGLKTAFISINELPRTRETLILRILGSGPVQAAAVADVFALSPDQPERSVMLRILSNWKLTIELGGIEIEEQETIMALSQAFLEWEQATQQQGLKQGLEQGLEREQALVIRQLNRKIGALSTTEESAISALSFEQTELLGEALLDFERMEDLRSWLEHQQ